MGISKFFKSRSSRTTQSSSSTSRTPATMDTKPSTSNALPPSYDAIYPSPTSSFPDPDAKLLPPPPPPCLSAQLSSLRSRIQSNKAISSTSASTQVPALIAQLSSFLDDYSKTHFSRARLTIVPASYVSDGATPADTILDGADEFVDFRRVEGDADWWSDSAKATEVARALEREVGHELERAEGHEEEEELYHDDRGEDAKVDERRKVKVKVTAEEVAFRSINVFGVWGTESGWGVVVKVGVGV